MLFHSGQLFFSILVFILLFVGCRWVFRKWWINNVVMLLGNALILTCLVRPNSLLILLVVALVCYGAGLLLYSIPRGWLLALVLSCSSSSSPYASTRSCGAGSASSGPTP